MSERNLHCKTKRVAIPALETTQHRTLLFPPSRVSKHCRRVSRLAAPGFIDARTQTNAWEMSSKTAHSTRRTQPCGVEQETFRRVMFKNFANPWSSGTCLGGMRSTSLRSNFNPYSKPDQYLYSTNQCSSKHFPPRSERQTLRCKFTNQS